MKLYSGDGGSLDAQLEEYTAGTDPRDDLRLVPYDCLASQAHARMLGRAGYLDSGEVALLIGELSRIRDDWERGRFRISPSQEDCHTAIEQRLTERLGEPGRRIHLGRSRNDQVLAALRLYARDEIDSCRRGLDSLDGAIGRVVEASGEVPLPGLTHTRKAMPSSVGLWLGGFIEALAEDRGLLGHLRRMTDRCPLGTGAGYGVPLRLDREYVARELGFAGILESPVYAQLSRGKLEASLIHGLWQVMLDLGRLASDLVLFGMEGLGFVVPDDGVCTGSSMMPQKRNPDVLELIRGNCAVVSSLEERVRGICSGLVSGYHRDLQLTKRPLMEAFSLTRGSLLAMEKVVCTMHIDEERCRAAMTEELYAFDRVCGLVAGGMPFRDAYLAVKDGLD